MTERKMSPKMWLHRSYGKIAPDVFIAKHRQFLSEGTLGILTASIFAAMDQKTMLPSAALSKIQEVCHGHILAIEAQKQEEALLSEGKTEAPKAYRGTVYTAQGDIAIRETDDGEESLQKGFHGSLDAIRWVQRRLLDGFPDWRGEVVNTSGNPIVEHVTRKDAIAVILAGKKGPAMHVTKTTKTLSFQQKCQGDHFHFSHGLEKSLGFGVILLPPWRNKTPGFILFGVSNGSYA